MSACSLPDSCAASETEFRALISQMQPADLIDIAGLLQKAILAHQLAQASLPGILAGARRAPQACSTR